MYVEIELPKNNAAMHLSKAIFTVHTLFSRNKCSEDRYWAENEPK